MREKDLQSYLYNHPEILFPDQWVDKKDREHLIDGQRVDLLFTVGDDRWIIEVKRDTIHRKDIGQLLDYYARMRHAGDTSNLRMMLVAPSIPEYLRSTLEEFRIRYVEVSCPPTDERLLADLDREASATFIQMVPPICEPAIAFADRFLRTSLQSVISNFPEYQIVPGKTRNARRQNILCFGLDEPNFKPRFTEAGASWAYALRKTGRKTKEDMPNLSVNALPWGLDVSVNAELLTSQRAVQHAINRFPKEFDSLVEAHGRLVFQAWFKLEHQKRSFHWFPAQTLPPGAWNGRNVLNTIATTGKCFDSLKKTATAWLQANRAGLSQEQISHLVGKNRKADLALRFVDSIKETSPFWMWSIGQQIEQLNCSYAGLKPLIDFLHGG
jgi:hypothetical protein